MDTNLETILFSGQHARLTPIVSGSKKGERATCCLLSTFMVAPEFAKQVLSEAGAPVGKQLHVECYTKVIFKSGNKSNNSRPDGFIVVNFGSEQWMALVESKIGNSQLSSEQIEGYLDLARMHGINAVITISNQFATPATHHPVEVNKNKLRSVQLYHFSWLSIVSIATLISANKAFEDREQSFLLSEFVRHLIE